MYRDFTHQYNAMQIDSSKSNIIEDRVQIRLTTSNYAANFKVFTYLPLEDWELPFPKLDQLIVSYQDPKEADKLLKLQDELAQVQTIMVSALDGVGKLIRVYFKILIKYFHKVK